MPTNVTWPPIGGTSYPMPTSGETNWPTLTNFLVALGAAQGTSSQKVAIRVAASSPISVSSALDTIICSDLTVPSAVVVNLPAGVKGQWFCVMDRAGTASGFNITITPNGVETIAGQASLVLNQDGASVIFAFDGSGNWVIIAQAAGEGSGGGISRSAIDAATPNWVVINGASGILSEEQFLSATRGGLGVDASAFTGYLKFSSGVPTAAAILAAELPAGIDAAKIGDGSVSTAEFQFLNTVTSNVQTQLNAKLVPNAPITPSTRTKITYDANGFVTAGADIAAADLPSGIDPAKLSPGTVSSTEFGFLDGVTSSIQTALDSKAIGVASAVDSEVVLFSGTGGKSIKRATGTGVAHLTGGVLSASVVTIPEGGTGQVTANAALNALLPSQTSQATKYLQTDGTNSSWAASSGAGGLAGVLATANVSPAAVNTMYECTSTGGFTITLPTIPAGGGVIGIMDAGETCSATNFIRVTPATGQSIDGYPVNDSLVIDYVRANIVGYAAAGASSWKVQYQATTMLPPASAGVPGSINWYEEGTFTPTLVSAGGGSQTSGTRTGRFTRIGRQVSFSINIAPGSIASLSAGSLSVSGLPYAAASGFNTSCIISEKEGVTHPANGNPYAAIAGGNSSISLAFSYSNAASATAMQLSAVNSGVLFAISGIYYV